jgi:hypothetical protein
MVFAALMVVALIGVPWVGFALVWLLVGFPRLRLQQILGIVGVFGWIFAFIWVESSSGTEWLLSITTIAILMAFAGMWLREFPLLMARRSDEFPDRFDKLAWVFVLTAMAPAGVWLFRSYRRTRWPESTKAAVRHPLDEPDPGSGVDVPEMDQIRA